MDSKLFLDAATTPERWFEQSVILRKSGATLWEKFESTLCADEVRHDDAREAIINDAVGYLQTAQLLYALAVETALKGVLVRDHPGQIEFSLAMDGNQQITNAQLKKLGSKTSDGHNLERLAELAGLIRPNRDPGDRAILRHLSDCIRWRSRYPIPLANDAYSPFPENLPRGIVGHHFRDFVDPILDKLLAQNQDS